MRTVFLVLVAAGISVAVDRAVIRPAAHADANGGDEAADISCADLNNDGNTDLTDAVHLLLHLYSGGPAPVCPKGGRLPDTGQMTCYDGDGGSGSVIPCADTTYPGQDGAYATGCPSTGRFVDNGDGTVTDKCTGLMWQKGTADVDGNGSVGDEDGVNWQGALQYCENLDFAGHGDWRLPNIRELLSILDWGGTQLMIDPVFDALSAVYHSSTSYAHGPTATWTVRFGVGWILGMAKDRPAYVRAVRSGP